MVGALAYAAWFERWFNDPDAWHVDRLAVVLQFVLAWNVILLISAIVTLVDAIRKIGAGRTATLAGDVLLVKLASIPFFIANFLMLALLGLVGAVGFLFGGLALMAVAALAIIPTWLAMLSTSTYGWAAVLGLAREKRIARSLAVTYSISLFLFVVDIVAAALIYTESRPRGNAPADAIEAAEPEAEEPAAELSAG